MKKMIIIMIIVVVGSMYVRVGNGVNVIKVCSSKLEMVKGNIESFYKELEMVKGNVENHYKELDKVMSSMD